MTNLLLEHPLAGAPTDDPTIRRIVTTPYPYLIFYEATRTRLLFTPCAMVHAIRLTIQDQPSACRIDPLLPFVPAQAGTQGATCSH